MEALFDWGAPGEGTKHRVTAPRSPKTTGKDGQGRNASTARCAESCWTGGCSRAQGAGV